MKPWKWHPKLNIPLRIPSATTLFTTLLGICLITLSVSALGNAFYWERTTIHDFTIHGPLIHTDSLRLTRQLNRLLAKQFYQIHNLPLHEMTTLFQRFPAIQSWTMTINEQAHIHFFIQERKPVLRIILNGKVLCMDLEGVLFPDRRRGVQWLPTCWLNASTSTPVDSILASLRSVLPTFHELQSKKWIRWIAHFAYVDSQWWAILRIADTRIHLGTTSQLPTTLNALGPWLHYLAQNNLWLRYRKATLAFPGRIIAKKRQP